MSTASMVLASDLRHREMENAQWFADYLTLPSLDLESPEGFAEIVKQAVDVYQIDVEAICRRFNVARTTVSRWKSGKNAPQPFARPVVVAWIGEQARARADGLRTELGAA